MVVKGPPLSPYNRRTKMKYIKICSICHVTTLEDQIKVDVLLNKYQTYIKLYMLLLTFGIFCHSNHMVLAYFQLKVIK
jgi:hypothetical protein